MPEYSLSTIFACMLCPEQGDGDSSWRTERGLDFLKHLEAAHGISAVRAKAEMRGSPVAHLCGGRNGSTHIKDLNLDGRLVGRRTESVTRKRMCSFCKVVEVAFECDAVMDRLRYPRKDGSKTCDAAMCRRCALEVGPDRHFCPKHRAQSGAPEQRSLF
jgi:hypothetical protein